MFVCKNGLNLPPQVGLKDADFLPNIVGLKNDLPLNKVGLKLTFVELFKFKQQAFIHRHSSSLAFKHIASWQACYQGNMAITFMQVC